MLIEGLGPAPGGALLREGPDADARLRRLAG